MRIYDLRVSDDIDALCTAIIGGSVICDLDDQLPSWSVRFDKGTLFMGVDAYSSLDSFVPPSWHVNQCDLN